MSVVDAYATMKRHLCRHSGLVRDTYAELRRHVESYSTPSVNQHSYSVAPPAAVPPSVHAKRTKYACKCDATFGRWDDLQHHVRSVCLLSVRNVGCTSRPAECQRGIQRTRARASDMSRHGWRHQQVGEQHDGYIASDE